jgi:hypothetical protein
MSKQSAVELYSHLYGKEVMMDDRFETKVIWSEELALKNNGKWIPKEVTMNKQTAVQFLIEKIHFDANVRCFSQVEWNEIFEQAKQMEKEQIEMACNQQEFEDIDGLGICETISKGQQYYNETYGETKKDYE